jgi:hypothetical protein
MPSRRYESNSSNYCRDPIRRWEISKNWIKAGLKDEGVWDKLKIGINIFVKTLSLPSIGDEEDEKKVKAKIQLIKQTWF